MALETAAGWLVDQIVPKETDLGFGLYAVKVGPFIVNIKQDDEGIVVDVYADKKDHGDSLGSTWVLYSEAEEDDAGVQD